MERKLEGGEVEAEEGGDEEEEVEEEEEEEAEEEDEKGEGEEERKKRLLSVGSRGHKQMGAGAGSLGSLENSRDWGQNRKL